MKKKNITVTKASGEKVLFSEERLINSLKRSGANEELINRILYEIEDLIYEGIPTKKIYQKAFSLLKKFSASVAAKYDLKKAVINLGPSGYPFEKLVGTILNYQGFNVKVGQIVEGHCVQHEIDVLAESADLNLIVECKYHQTMRNQCDVKVPLYVQSRFLDVEKQLMKHPTHNGKTHQCRIFTNTRFSGDAVKYANCMGIKLIGWDFPSQGSLKELIDVARLHPLTCLTTISAKEKSNLLEQGLVLLKDIVAAPESLQAAGIEEKRFKRINSEIEGIINLS